jgi:hypothetical protein
MSPPPVRKVIWFGYIYGRKGPPLCHPMWTLPAAVPARTGGRERELSYINKIYDPHKNINSHVTIVNERLMNMIAENFS